MHADYHRAGQIECFLQRRCDNLATARARSGEAEQQAHRLWIGGKIDFLSLPAVQLRHPVLRVSVEPGPHALPCFREHTENPIPIRIVPEGESAAWHSEMAKELETPIPFSGAPPARITLLRKRNEAQ